MKINVGVLRPLRADWDTRTFRDPEQPGIEVPITLRQMDALLFGKGCDLADAMKDFYIVQGTPFPPYLEGQAIELSNTLCEQVAPVCVLQKQDGSSAYTFEELVVIAATMPGAWINIQLFAAEKQRVKIEDQAKNSSGAPSDAS